METQSMAVDNLIVSRPCATLSLVDLIQTLVDQGRQQEAAAAVSILSASINELSETTTDRIESINATVLALRRSLSFNSGDNYMEWICRILFYDMRTSPDRYFDFSD
jgi:hypothetical protein